MYRLNIELFIIIFAYILHDLELNNIVKSICQSNTPYDLKYFSFCLLFPYISPLSFSAWIGDLLGMIRLVCYVIYVSIEFSFRR